MDFFFLGGRLAVDLLNTVIVQDGRVHDLLSRGVDVASWGEAAGVVSRRDLRNAAREPAGLAAFREALRHGLVAWAAPRSARSTSAAGRSRAGRRLRRGQPHGEGTARAGDGVDRDVAALQLGQEPRDRQAEPGAPEVATA